MADAAAAAPAPAAPPAKLDDLMLAMDVVDTLRHEEALVEKELSQDMRDEALKKRLREIYESQGLTVTDRILDEGIKALKESRFAYTPPQPSFATFMARLWIGRRVVLPLVAIAAAVVAVVIIWQVRSAGESTRVARQCAAEIGDIQDAPLAAAAGAACAVVSDPDAIAAIDAMAMDGEAAAKAGDAEGMKTAIAGLETLRAALVQTYQLRIVSREGEDTGVYRIPDINEGAKNYYIIVEPVTDKGDVLSLPVVNEEDQKTYTVSKWGVRVPEATYNKVRDDKLEDGIVQDNILGEKPRGTLKVTYLMPVDTGAITSW